MLIYAVYNEHLFPNMGVYSSLIVSPLIIPNPNGNGVYNYENDSQDATCNSTSCG